MMQYCLQDAFIDTVTTIYEERKTSNLNINGKFMTKGQMKKELGWPEKLGYTQLVLIT